MDKTIRLKLKDLVIDEDIYPRKNRSKKTIESYQEALKAGAKFPPITIQKIRENDEIKTIGVDGYHRIEAHKNEGIEEIDAEYWKDEVLDKKENLEMLRIVSVKMNMKHGVRLNETDISFQCERIVQDRPIDNLKGIQNHLAKEFGLTEGRISQMVGALVNRRKASRDSIILRLKMLGWSSPEISKVVGIDDSTIRGIVGNFNTKEINDSFSKGKSIEELASYYQLDQTLVWAIILEGKEDGERLGILSEKVDEFSCKPRPYDVWNFAKSHQLMGYKYPGRIPGQINLQLLYFYTKQNDFIVDPMAGSGTTADACLLMNRECRAYDIGLLERRKDIQQADAIEAIKNLKKKPNLIFLDPPYFKKKDKEYGEKSISNLSKEKYLDYFSRLADVCIEKLAPGGKVAFLMSDYTEDDPSESIFIHHYIKLFEERGFVVERIILCPLSTEQIHPDFIIKYSESRKLCRLARYLVLFCA